MDKVWHYLKMLLITMTPWPSLGYDFSAFCESKWELFIGTV
jgi:hypothetical protein